LLIRLPNLTPAKIVFALTAIAVSYFLVIGVLNAIHSQALSDQEGDLEREVSTLQERYVRLQAVGEYLNSDEFIESIARQQLGLVREGETAIVAIPETPAQDPNQSATEPEDRLWWEAITR